MAVNGRCRYVRHHHRQTGAVIRTFADVAEAGAAIFINALPMNAGPTEHPRLNYRTVLNYRGVAKACTRNRIE